MLDEFVDPGTGQILFDWLQWMYWDSLLQVYLRHCSTPSFQVTRQIISSTSIDINHKQNVDSKTALQRCIENPATPASVLLLLIQNGATGDFTQLFGDLHRDSVEFYDKARILMDR